MNPTFLRPRRASLLALLAFLSGPALHAQNPSVFVTLQTGQGTSGTTPATATASTINPPGTGWAYSAAAPVAGTTWNGIKRPNPLIGSGTLNGTVGLFDCNSANNIALFDPTGAASPVHLTASINVADLEAASSTRIEPNTGNGGSTVLGPNGLMNEAWRIYRGGNTMVFKLTGLPANSNYYLYLYASTTANTQGCKITLDAPNVLSGGASYVEIAGGNSGNIFATDGTTYSLTAPATPGQANPTAGPTWGLLQATADATGTIKFTTTKHSSGVHFFNGFQLMAYPTPVITVQPPATPSATIGSDVNLSVTATGPGTLTYQWRRNGSPMDTLANPSAATSTLTLSNVQSGDAANYDVIITNPGGSVTSNTSALSVTSSVFPPSISIQPLPQNAIVGGSASFSVSANGTSPLAFQWQKSNDNITFTNVDGATTSLLTFNPVQTSQAGYYRVIVTNSVSSATSNVATLTVAPVIVTSPAIAVVTAGSTKTISVVADAGAGSPSPITYVWKLNGVTVVDGAGISGATTANLQISNFGIANSGDYTVTVSNPAGAATSNSVYVGIPSTQPVTFAPADNSTGIAIDQQLRLVFPSAPKLGKSGKVTIRDAADDSIVATIDRSQFVTFSMWADTVPNALTRTVQGTSYYYMPIAIYGNEVWITLSPTQRLSYNKTYYVNIDPALLLDSTNAAYPGISDTTSWSFSTKAAGPATPTASTGLTTLTVGHDGTGDFATLQGASDWIPQNNTLPRTIIVKPGTYRDNTTFAQNRNFVTIQGGGAQRSDVQIFYPYPSLAPGNDRNAGTLRLESSDINVRNLTLDNASYKTFVGPLNTVYTSGKRLVFENIMMKGGQDTLFCGGGGSVYFTGSEIWGSVDFIYGDALMVFDHCNIVQIRNTGGPIGAPSTPFAQPHGLVFLDCNFPRAQVSNGYPYTVNVNSTTMMRPWQQDGAVAAINCVMDTHISTKGWSEWDGRENTSRSREYGTTLTAGGTVTPAQRQAAGCYWLNTIDPDYTQSMSPTNASLTGAGTANRIPVTVNPADYTLAAIFGHPYFNLNGWLPALKPLITTQPSAITTNPGQNVSFSVSASGTASLTYQWYKNNVLIPGATASTYNIPSAAGSHVGNYTVVLSNSVDSVTSSGAQLAFSDPLQNYVSSYGLDPLANGAPMEDPDGDGTCNKLEFFLGGNPALSQPGIVPTSHLTQSPDTIVFEFDRNTSASAMAYAVEHTSDLGGAWSPVVHGQNGVTIIVSPVDAQKDHITVTIPQSGSKDFARLRLP